jgi:hypothetical protein
VIGFTGWNPEGGVETGEMGFRFGGFAGFAVLMTEVEGERCDGGGDVTLFAAALAGGRSVRCTTAKMDI